MGERAALNLVRALITRRRRFVRFWRLSKGGGEAGGLAPLANHHNDMQRQLASISNQTQPIYKQQTNSVYVPSQSVPASSMFFFAYAVTITNESDRVVMLKSR